MGVVVFGNEFFDEWLHKKSSEILSKVERETISNEDMLILSLKAQVNHFHHMDIEFRGEFQSIRSRFIEIDKKFDEVAKRFAEMDMRFVQIDKRFEQVDKRFEQVDKRFEQVDKRFEQVDKRFDRLETVLMWGFGLFLTSQMGILLKLFL